MFQLRLSNDEVIGLGISREGIVLSLARFEGGAPITAFINKAELSLVARAFEAVRVAIVDNKVYKPPRVLEFVPRTKTGKVSMFVPTDEHLDGQQAVLWVSNGTGGDGAVYLDHADLDQVADWARATAEVMRSRTTSKELNEIYRTMGFDDDEVQD